MPTCFEIYETYQRGPAAVLRLFEEALGTRAIYGPPDPDTQQRTIDALSDEIGASSVRSPGSKPRWATSRRTTCEGQRLRGRWRAASPTGRCR
jgi:hypothetical protein